MQQIRPPFWKEKFLRSGYFLGALLFHLLLFIMLANVVLFRSPAPPVEAEFQAVHIPAPPPPPKLPSAGDVADTVLEPQLVPVPPSTPQNIINNVANTSFQVDCSKVVEQALNHLSLPAPQSTGLTQGGGDLGRGPGISGSADFFGGQAQGKRIAFLLDYSGSMKGAFREAMQRQLEAALKKLPDGSQVILICWAGPAWLYNQTEPKIAKKWKKLGAYDNFALLPGVTLAPPQWIDINPTSIGEIMQGIKAQVTAPGGTDWRQPFLYAMEADPPPDTIFFLTDGQIPPATTNRALAAISMALKKSDSEPLVNCLWIENPTNKSDAMETLAKTHNGEFLRVATGADHP